MEQIIRGNYHRETKVVDAMHPRSRRDATIVHSRDKLQVVYDVFTLKNQIYRNLDLKLNLLFLHGSGMNRVIWDYYVAHILKYDLGDAVINKIVTLDQVTHGDSAVLNSGKLGVSFDWSDGARDACIVAQKEFWGETDDASTVNIIIGHSMGGFQAMNCGILMPSLFHYIITIEPVALSPNIPNKENRTIAHPRFINALSVKIRDSFTSEADYENFMKKKSFFTNTHPEIIQRFMDSERLPQSDGSIRTKMERRQEIICYLTLHPTANWFLDSVKHIKVPVVSIVGEIAKWSPPENQETLKRLIPNYTKDIIPGGGHLVNIEMPNEVLQKIVWHLSNFLADYKSKNYDDQNLSSQERDQKFTQMFDKFLKDGTKNDIPILSKF